MSAETEFDASLMKKKKKKKPVMDADDADAPKDKTGDAPAEEAEPGEVAEENLEEEFGKKKKKKKKPVMLEEEEVNEKPPGEQEDGEDEDEELDFSKKKPKKKAKKKVDFDEDEEEEGEMANTSGEPDYSYDELLERVFNIMHEKNPDLITGEKKKFVMRPPRVARVGTKKTAFVNFSEICKLLHRQAKHLLAFLLAELGTSGSVDGNNQLIIKGRFQQKHIENVLRKYIKEYVTCHTCKSAETNLQKDTRLFFLQCETCGSRCSVTSIKSGFQAITTKRARRRAAAP